MRAIRGSTLPIDPLPTRATSSLAVDLELDRVSGRQRSQDARGGEVDETGTAGLAHLLDEQRGGRLLRAAACRSPAGLCRRPISSAQPVDVALRDAVGGVALERLLVRLERLGVTSELGERLPEAVVGIDVGAELKELPVRVDCVLPLAAAWRVPIAASASWRRCRVVVSASPSAMSDASVSDVGARGGRRPGPKGALLYHRARGVSTRPTASGSQGRCRSRPTTRPKRASEPNSTAMLRPEAGPRSASAAPLQA